MSAEVLLIGGRSGVGKTVVGWEVSAQLRAAAVPHGILEGDFLGPVHPAPDGDPDRTGLVERNLTAVWRNIAASDATATTRLTGRELGSELDDGLRNSVVKARLLEAEVPPDTVRIPTDDRPVTAVAADAVAATGWVATPA